MSLITSFRTFLIKRPASTTFKDSYGKIDSLLPHVIVCLEDETGRTGWGEATPLTEFTGETAVSIQLILEQELLPKLMGIHCLDIALAHEIMDKTIPHNTSAKAAVDMALYDLSAKMLGIPEYRLLGGACRKEIPITRPLGISSVEEAVSLAKGYVQLGHRTLKMKVGVDPFADVERVRAVREAVGPEVAIRIDGNMAYDLSTALRVLEALRPVGIQYCEQPLPAWDHKGLATLRAHTGVPIAADESLHTLQDALRLAEHQAVDVFVIKLIKTSGLWPALQIAGIAKSVGIDCVVVSPFDTQIGGAHALHLATALPNMNMACELTVFPAQPELAETSHQLALGTLITSDAPGCGVDSIVEINNS